MKISTRIYLSFIVVLIVVLLVTGVGVYQYTLSTFKKEVSVELLSGSRAMAEHVRTYVNDQKNTGEILAAASVYLDFLKDSDNEIIRKKIDSRLERTVAVDKENILAVMILDNKGTVLASSEKEEEGKDKSNEGIFVAEQKGSFIKNIHISEKINIPVYTISVPIVSEGKLLGYSVIKYNTKGLVKILENYGKESKTKEAFLLDKERYFLTASRFLGGEVVLKKIVNTNNAKQCFEKDNISQGISRFIENKDYRQVDVLGANSYIPETEWCLITKIDKSEFLLGPNKIANYFIYALFASIIFVFPIGFVFSKRIVKPLTDLNKAMKSVQSGNLEFKMGKNRKDEIGDLSREFDKMTKAIKQSRSDVDKKVSEQTKDIVGKAQDIEDQRKALMNILEDVEETNEDLAKFKMAVENASDHIVITDADGMIVYANKSVELITGFESSFVLGKKSGNKELWGGLMEIDFYKNLWKTIKEDKKVFSGEINNKRKNGEKYVALASISPVFDADGKVIYFVGIERDVTKAKEVDKMKTEFISLASHQLRTPLTAIKWYTEMLVNGDGGKLNKEQGEFATNIQSSNERMIELVNSLLNISRIESGRIIIDPQATDVKQLVADTIKDLEMKIKEKKINIVPSIHENLPLIKMDPKLIRNVLMNLLSNSIKYSCDGCEVIIMVSKDDKDVTFQISDSGLGIPLKEQDKVFEKFYRGQNVIKKVTDGNGLGLYLVKSIVESSGGKIWFKSVENKGTTFYFSLPLAGVKAKAGEVVIDG